MINFKKRKERALSRKTKRKEKQMQDASGGEDLTIKY